MRQSKVKEYEHQTDPVRYEQLSNGIDQMVYKLYDLTEEEIRIVEGLRK